MMIMTSVSVHTLIKKHRYTRSQTTHSFSLLEHRWEPEQPGIRFTLDSSLPLCYMGGWNHAMHFLKVLTGDFVSSSIISSVDDHNSMGAISTCAETCRQLEPNCVLM